MPPVFQTRRGLCLETTPQNWRIPLAKRILYKYEVMIMTCYYWDNLKPDHLSNWPIKAIADEVSVWGIGTTGNVTALSYIS